MELEDREKFSQEFHQLYSATDNILVIKSRRMKWVRYVEFMGTKRNSYKVLLRNAELKISIERPRPRWENIIKINLREIRWDDVYWIHLAGSCEHGNEPSGPIKKLLNFLSN
jgi:hypothetical protein